MAFSSCKVEGELVADDVKNGGVQNGKLGFNPVKLGSVTLSISGTVIAVDDPNGLPAGQGDPKVGAIRNIVPADYTIRGVINYKTGVIAVILPKLGAFTGDLTASYEYAPEELKKKYADKIELAEQKLGFKLKAGEKKKIKVLDIYGDLDPEVVQDIKTTQDTEAPQDFPGPDFFDPTVEPKLKPVFNPKTGETVWTPKQRKVRKQKPKQDTFGKVGDREIIL